MDLVTILALQYPNAVVMVDYTLKQDKDGNISIDVWDLATPKPTKAQLNQWAVTYALEIRQKAAVGKRAYPPIGDQLDMIYWDSVNKTTVWQDTIAAIKAANPKPTE